MFFNRLKLVIWGAGETLEETVKETKKKINNFVDRTRLGGLIKYRKADFEEVSRLGMLYANEVADDREALGLFAVDGEKPLVKDHEILEAFRFDRKNDGDLLSEMALISDILVYTAHLRLDKKSEEYTNSSTLLFCAEFAKWANAMAKMEITEAVHEEIQSRLRYLSCIQEEGVFRNEPNDEHSIYLLIHNLSQILNYAILPRIEIALSSLSVRDYLKQLKKDSDKFFKDTTTGLFYMFTEEEDFTYNVFHLRYLDIYQIPRLRNIMDNTELGDLFKELSRQFQLSQTGHLAMEKPTNYFLTEKGEVDFDLSMRISISDEVNNTKDRGIHPFMLKDQTPTHLLLSTMGRLSDYICFMSALNQAYNLSGDGGNLLMYIKLGTEMANFLACFHELQSQLKLNLNRLLELSDTVFQELIKGFKFDHPWKLNYCRSKRLIGDALTHLNNASRVVGKISEQLSYVNSENYLLEVQGRMEEFSHTLDTLNGRLQLQLPVREKIEALTYTVGLSYQVELSDELNDFSDIDVSSEDNSVKPGFFSQKNKKQENSDEEVTIDDDSRRKVAGLSSTTSVSSDD
jgi:hypothetical protein